MKAKHLVGVLVGVCVALGGTLALAQETPGVNVAVDWQLKPGHEVQFEEGRTESLAFLSEHDFPVNQPVFWNGEENVVRFLASFDSWEGLDTVEQWFRAAGPMPSADTINDATQQVSISLWRPRADLLYAPDNPAIQPGEAGFIREIRFTLRPGTNEEAEAILRKMAEVNEQHGIQMGRVVWFQFSGSEGPLVALFSAAENAADMASRSAADTETMGDEIRMLRRELSSLATKREFRNWTIRRDLAYLRAN